MGKANKKKRIIAWLVIITIAALTIIPRSKTLLDLTIRKRALEQEKQQLIKANQELAEQLNQIQSPEYVERLAREKLGMVKAGERIVMPVSQDN